MSSDLLRSGTNADSNVARIVTPLKGRGRGLEWKPFADQIGEWEVLMVIREEFNGVQQILGNIVVHPANRQISADNLLW
jgi:hypothetical protein